MCSSVCVLAHSCLLLCLFLFKLNRTSCCPVFFPPEFTGLCPHPGGELRNGPGCRVCHRCKEQLKHCQVSCLLHKHQLPGFTLSLVSMQSKREAAVLPCWSDTCLLQIALTRCFNQSSHFMLHLKRIFISVSLTPNTYSLLLPSCVSLHVIWWYYTAINVACSVKTDKCCFTPIYLKQAKYWLHKALILVTALWVIFLVELFVQRKDFFVVWLWCDSSSAVIQARFQED